MLGSSPNKCRFVAWKIIDIEGDGSMLETFHRHFLCDNDWAGQLGTAPFHGDVTGMMVDKRNHHKSGRHFQVGWLMVTLILSDVFFFLVSFSPSEADNHGGWHALLIALGRFQILDEPLLLLSVYEVLWAPAWCHVPWLCIIISNNTVFIYHIYIYIIYSLHTYIYIYIHCTYMI